MDKLFSINCHYIKTFTGAELLNHLTEFDSKYQKVDVKTFTLPPKKFIDKSRSQTAFCFAAM